MSSRIGATPPVNAGSYEVTASFAGSTDYSSASSSTVDFSISKANATINVSGYSVAYDGNSHTATGTVAGVVGESLSGLDLSGTTHTTADPYTDSWTFTDTTGNYNNASGTVSDSIAKANATINVSGYNVTYDGNAHTDTGTVTGVGGVNLSSELDLSSTTHTTAGAIRIAGASPTRPAITTTSAAASATASPMPCRR